jgi:DNA-binding response OmpR family regulator
MKTILVVDDEPAIVRGLEEALKAEHFAVLTSHSGEKGYLMAKREKIDLLILDLRLPDKNGEEICRDLRKDGINVPILMLTSKKTETDKVVGLESGADDYVTKPFGIREVVARIHALLRRKPDIAADLDEYTFGKVHIDFHAQEARKGKSVIPLRTRECEILKYFARHEGEVVTRDMLLNEVWGYEEFPTTRTVDNYIVALRKKLEDTPGSPVHFLTVHTSGYKFVK